MRTFLTYFPLKLSDYTLALQIEKVWVSSYYVTRLGQGKEKIKRLKVNTSIVRGKLFYARFPTYTPNRIILILDFDA